MKNCGKCKKSLPFSEFHASKAKGYQNYCKKCAGIRRAQWARENKEKVKTYRIKSNHGLTEEKYQELLVNQNGVCGMCKKPFIDDKKIHIDHDHSCCPGVKSCGNCVRGLLHPHCNFIVGWFEAFPEEFGFIEEYLTIQSRSVGMGT